MGSRIVILGAGHAGLRCARTLAKFLSPSDDLVVISRENYFLYYPFLRDLVAGAADLLEVAFPLRDILPRKARLIVGTVETITNDGHQLRVTLPDGESVELECDHLVIALGSTTSFHQVHGASANALAFKSVEDALRLRLKVLDALESATGGGTHPTDVVIAGGGYTGLEVAGALHDLFRRAHREYGRVLSQKPPRIHIIEGEDKLLGNMPAPIPDYAHRLLTVRGDRILLHQEVASVEPDGVTLKDGSRILAAATVWTAGVKATPALDAYPWPRGKDGRLVVDAQLRVAPSIWAIGDCAGVPHEGATAPMTAQSAEAEAELAAKNVAHVIMGRAPRSFDHRSRGMIVPMGGGMGAAQFGKHVLTGRSAGLLWRAFHLTQLPGMSRRVRYVAGWWTGAPRARALVRAPAISLQPSNRRPS